MCVLLIMRAKLFEGIESSSPDRHKRYRIINILLPPIFVIHYYYLIMVNEREIKHKNQKEYCYLVQYYENN